MPAITRPREWWQKYRRLMEPTCGPIQLLETRKAFIAGMFASMESMLQTIELNEEQSIQALDQFERELHELKDEVTKNQMENFN